MAAARHDIAAAARYRTVARDRVNVKIIIYDSEPFVTSGIKSLQGIKVTPVESCVA